MRYVYVVYSFFLYLLSLYSRADNLPRSKEFHDSLQIIALFLCLDSFCIFVTLSTVIFLPLPMFILNIRMGYDWSGSVVARKCTRYAMFSSLFQSTVDCLHDVHRGIVFNQSQCSMCLQVPGEPAIWAQPAGSSSRRDHSRPGPGHGWPGW